MRAISKKAYELNTIGGMRMNAQQYAMDWWMKEEQRRATRSHANQVHLVNQRLSRAISILMKDLRKEDYKDEACSYNRHLVQSNIWVLCYQNNFENPFVMGVQAAWIALIFDKEKEKGNAHNLCYNEYEFRQLLSQIRNTDSTAFQMALNQFPHLKEWL